MSGYSWSVRLSIECVKLVPKPRLVVSNFEPNIDPKHAAYMKAVKEDWQDIADRLGVPYDE